MGFVLISVLYQSLTDSKTPPSSKTPPLVRWSSDSEIGQIPRICPKTAFFFRLRRAIDSILTISPLVYRAKPPFFSRLRRAIGSIFTISRLYTGRKPTFFAPAAGYRQYFNQFPACIQGENPIFSRLRRALGAVLHKLKGIARRRRENFWIVLPSK